MTTIWYYFFRFYFSSNVFFLLIPNKEFQSIWPHFALSPHSEYFHYTQHILINHFIKLGLAWYTYLYWNFSSYLFTFCKWTMNEIFNSIFHLAITESFDQRKKWFQIKTFVQYLHTIVFRSIQNEILKRICMFFCVIVRWLFY